MLHCIHPGSKTPYAPIEQTIGAFESSETETSWADIERQNPSVVDLFRNESVESLIRVRRTFAVGERLGLL